jgi:L-asparaginase / beta-aspartyl-peptidase
MKIPIGVQNCILRKYFAIIAIFIMGLLPGIKLSAQTEAVPVTSAGMAVGLEKSDQKWAIVIHGGAGGPAKGTMTDEKGKAYLDKLNEALKLGSEILRSGGSSVDAVQSVVMFMEDCPLFNAGIGAVLNENGKAELDAAIMDGRTGMAGAVAGVTTIKNPVMAARMVMDKTSHVMLVGQGAEDFAKKTGLKMVDPSYFITPERMEAWKKWKSGVQPEKKETPDEKEKHGTVGAVALDQKGNLAAATSTGGMMGKMAGRVGDSPIIGAGTYASNNTCAVSATGHGEYFIRNVVAYDLPAMMEYRGLSVSEAAEMIIMKKLRSQNAEGGLIAIDKEGNIAMPFNTNAMFRGFAKSTGEQEVAIY